MSAAIAPLKKLW